MARAQTSRRSFLAGAAATGAVLVARPSGVLADVLGGDPASSVARASKLVPGTWLVHADMHNHTLFSDGDGDPAAAFASMRSAGLDVAALTDHAVLGGALGAVASVCGAGCTSVRGIDEASWRRSAQLADGADDPGRFTAIRGFEWSSPTMGHVNVWFGQQWVDPERTGGLVGLEGVAGYLDELTDGRVPVGEPLEELVGALPTNGLTMAPFYAWLRRQPGGLLAGGGADALAGFNHPGREPGRFGAFAYDERLRDRMVSLELFNRDEDYLYEGTDRGRTSPLTQCLDAGWRPGLLGVTDEHGTDWGEPLGKGRAGVWVTELSRAGVRRALSERRFFATRERGLRVDATLAGVRMGGTVGATGPQTVRLDVEGVSVPAGTPLLVQVLRTGSPLPTVADQHTVIVPAADAPPVSFTTPVDPAAGPWTVLRIVDPADDPDPRATADLAGRTIAYASPWYLEPPTTPTGAPPARPQHHRHTHAHAHTP